MADHDQCEGWAPQPRDVTAHVAQIDMPHIVVTLMAGKAVAYSGPYAGALLALRAAEVEQVNEREGGGDDRMAFKVLPLYPPPRA